jgi:hypothetical protein
MKTEEKKSQPKQDLSQKSVVKTQEVKAEAKK